MIPLLALFALLPLLHAASCSAPRAVCNPLLPPGYLSPTFTSSRAQLDSYAQKSIDSLLARTDHKNGYFKDGGGFWTAQNGWTAVADYDRLRGSKVFAARVSAAQDLLVKTSTTGVPLVNEFNDDAGWAALANLRAYEAYGEKKYLDRAKVVWEYLTTQIVTEQVLNDGYLKSVKNPDNKISRTCNGKSMLGGVYWVNGGTAHPDQAKDAGVNAVSTGLFALLSAELCGITKDKAKYCSKGYRSAQWLDDHVVGPDGLLWDGVHGTTCKITDWKFTYNAALYIGAYATLGSLTSNATALLLAERTAKESLKTTQWNSPNGIIKEGAGDVKGSDDGIGFKSVLVRALYRSYPYFKDAGLKAAIVEYVNIQYYGLTQLDADSKTQPVEYGRNWAGPAYQGSTAHAQLAALDVLNAITLNPKSAFLKAEAKGMTVIKTQPRVGGC